jgi:hypothetical protein
MTYDPNTSHPKIDYKGTYPNMHVTQRADGSQDLRSLDPGNESHFNIQATGNYTGHGPDGAEVSVTTGKHHKYNADGVSSTADGHVDTQTSASNRNTVAGSDHNETAGNKYSAGGGVSVAGSHDSHIHHSSGDGHHTTDGDIITDHSGNIHSNIDGDYVHQISGNHIEMKGGEYGIHLSKGNFDIQLDKGNYRASTQGSVLIQSATRITFRVGNSQIQIQPDGIQLSTDGFLNLFINKGSDNLSIINYGSGQAQIGAAGNAVIAGNKNIIKSTTGTQLEKGTIPPLPFPGLPPEGPH